MRIHLQFCTRSIFCFLQTWVVLLIGLLNLLIIYLCVFLSCGWIDVWIFWVCILFFRSFNLLFWKPWVIGKVLYLDWWYWIWYQNCLGWLVFYLWPGKGGVIFLFFTRVSLLKIASFSCPDFLLVGNRFNL